jgi:hypothetical protein
MDYIQIGDLVRSTGRSEWAPKGPGLVIGKEQLRRTLVLGPDHEELRSRFHVLWLRHNLVRYGYLRSRLEKLEIPNE